MAEIKQGILGGVSGKVGTVVGAQWRGKNIIRSLPRKSAKKPTILQLNQRSKFRLVSNFLQPLNPLLSHYFGSDQGLKSRVNLGLAYHLNEAIDNPKGQGGSFTIIYEKVVLSKGILPSVVMEKVSIDNGAITLAWTNNAGGSLAKDTDLLTVVVFDKKNKEMQIFEKVATRSSATFSTPLPASYDASTTVIWFFFTNDIDTECSTSMFEVVS